MVGKLDESLLQDVGPFRRLDRGQIREILDLATARRFDEGAAVFREGHPAERFHLLMDGVIRVMRITAEGDAVTALHIPSGQLFGIARALRRETYPATAVCARECLTLSWPMSLWDGFVARYDGFAEEGYRTVGTRVGEMNTRLIEMATQQVEQRVAGALLRLIDQSGRKGEAGIEIAFPVTRQDISEMTGTTLHSVSRLLSAWEKAGIVASRRRHVTVTDPRRLELIGEGR
ncbi:Crp/Fnr family transcriptional regulator [Rhodovulum sulfidophilum]|uniref:Crp/Fnr family transcriptional regulator n=1 Tax=Rhodovulum sulfidophilum TaxID=35806 RepID=UPI0019210326|nr:Crp/Fnr family transcriptional regulator [Rhodovulum sulfidophilum]MBL3594427.1 Crp/Fnr family transcriptional regulator [Rhodovulum sulfidophilum]